MRIFESTEVLIEHIGSTAIPGMVAKPIMDIAVAMDSIVDVNPYVEPLRTLKYEFRRDYRETDQYHVLFVKGPEKDRTHYLKLTEKHSDFWRSNLAFRDHIRLHPNKAAEYAKLKIRLAAQFAEDRESYTKAKKSFIETVLKSIGAPL